MVTNKDWLYLTPSQIEADLCSTFLYIHQVKHTKSWTSLTYYRNISVMWTISIWSVIIPSRLVYCRVAYRPRIRMGVITKFLQDKDSLHCIALFNVIQLYENLKWKTNKRKEHTVSNSITFLETNKQIIIIKKNIKKKT